MGWTNHLGQQGKVDVRVGLSNRINGTFAMQAYERPRSTTAIDQELRIGPSSAFIMNQASGEGGTRGH